jgi:iron complex transport system substrate-binding protein
MAFCRFVKYLCIGVCIVTPALGLPATEPHSGPQRIVSLSPAVTEILYALNAGDRLVGATRHCTYPREAQSLPKVGGFHEISVETVLSLEPDLVLAGDMHRSSVVPFLRSRGLRVEIVDHATIDALYRTIREIGVLLDKTEAADVLNARIQNGVQEIERRVAGRPRRKVLWLLSEDLWAAGEGSYIDDLIHRAGGINIARTGPWLQISSEAVLVEDPHVIFLMVHGDISDNATPEHTQARLTGLPGWRGLSAIRNDRVVPVADEDLMSRAGPRVAGALEFIARELHPDAFE